MLDQGEKALTRWLTIVTSHPVSVMIQSSRFSWQTPQMIFHPLRDQFRHLPDEFIISCAGTKSQRCLYAWFAAAVGDYRSKMDDAIYTLFRDWKSAECQQQETSGHCPRSWSHQRKLELCRLVIYPSLSLVIIRDQMYKATSQLNTIETCTVPRKEDSQVVQKALLLSWRASGSRIWLGVRHEKGLQDHKRGLEKIGMVKRRDTRGILRLDGAWREQIEKQVAELEIVLSDQRE